MPQPPSPHRTIRISSVPARCGQGTAPEALRPGEAGAMPGFSTHLAVRHGVGARPSPPGGELDGLSQEMALWPAAAAPSAQLRGRPVSFPGGPPGGSCYGGQVPGAGRRVRAAPVCPAPPRPQLSCPRPPQRPEGPPVAADLGWGGRCQWPLSHCCPRVTGSGWGVACDLSQC